MNWRMVMRKIISAVLCIVMVIGLLPCDFTYAEDANWIDDAEEITPIGNTYEINNSIPAETKDINNPVTESELEETAEGSKEAAKSDVSDSTAVRVADTLADSADVISGQCGDNLTYTLTLTNHTLEITGTGDMWDWTAYNRAPWYSHGNVIKTVHISDGMNSIGDLAFYKCDQLTDITIPNSVTDIGNDTFFYCENVTNIEIPNSVISIGDSAFSNCYNLTSITIPDSVNSIGNGAFYNCERLANISIPDSVTNIGDEAFGYCKSLTNIALPNGITNIGFSTFYACESLVSITIPDSVTSIGGSAFYNCNKLLNITISDSVNNIGGLVFFNCKSLTNITVDSNNQYYTSLDDVLFNKEKSTIICYPAGKADSEYIVPQSVTNISEYAFYGCNNLTSIKIPENLTGINNATFADCTNLTNITLPRSVTHIKAAAFSNCTSLSNIEIPGEVVSIDDYAFSRCESLTSIIIPEKVANIGHNPFAYCASMTNIVVDLNNQYYASLNGVLFNKENSSIICYPAGKVGGEYNIPLSVTDIENNTFAGCTNLTHITIPTNVINIRDNVFAECDNITNVIIHRGVTNIGQISEVVCFLVVTI